MATLERSKSALDAILVGVDGSTPCLRAVRFADELALATDAELTLVYVYDVPPGEDHLAARADAAAEPILAHAREALRPSAGATARLDVRAGDIATEILRAADERDVDLIVLGSGGLAATSPTEPYGVCVSVVRAAACPVVVVP